MAEKQDQDRMDEAIRKATDMLSEIIFTPFGICASAKLELEQAGKAGNDKPKHSRACGDSDQLGHGDAHTTTLASRRFVFDN